jgi:hypothetical protein
VFIAFLAGNAARGEPPFVGIVLGDGKIDPAKGNGVFTIGKEEKTLKIFTGTATFGAPAAAPPAAAPPAPGAPAPAAPAPAAAGDTLANYFVPGISQGGLLKPELDERLAARNYRTRIGKLNELIIELAKTYQSLSDAVARGH